MLFQGVNAVPQPETLEGDGALHHDVQVRKRVKHVFPPSNQIAK